MILLPTFQSCLLLCPNQQQQSVFLYAYYFLNTLSRGDKTTFVLFDIFKTISLYIRWADICFVFFFFFVEPYYYSLLFLEGDRQESLDHRLDDGDRVCCVVGRTQTHIAKPVSLSSIFFFFLSLVSYIFSSSSYFVIQQIHTPPISFSLFFSFHFLCVCVLAGWLPCISYSCATTGERKTPDCDGCASLVRRHWHWKEPGWAKLMTNEPKLRWFLFHFSPCFSSLFLFFSLSLSLSLSLLWT